jgi:hypothetical protein
MARDFDKELSAFSELSAWGNQKPSSEEPEFFGGAAKTTSSEGQRICSEEPGS